MKCEYPTARNPCNKEALYLRKIAGKSYRVCERHRGPMYGSHPIKKR